MTFNKIVNKYIICYTLPISRNNSPATIHKLFDESSNAITFTKNTRTINSAWIHNYYLNILEGIQSYFLLKNRF